MRWLYCAMALVSLTGCHAYHLDVDGGVDQRAALPIDVQPTLAEPLPPPTKKLPDPTVHPVSRPVLGAPVLMQGKEEKKGTGKTMLERLTPDDKLLGFRVPDITMPPLNAPPAEQEAAIKKQFPPLPAMPALPSPAPGPEGRPLTLSDLQQIAIKTNPVIRQALLDIDAARGAALQAGLYPNPIIGYEGTTIGQGRDDGSRTSGQQGGYVEQTIVTAGKLKLAREAALRDVQIHEQKLRQAEADLQAKVRRDYFALLSAHKSYESTKSLSHLSDELYAVLLLQLRAGEVAAYEPLQIRVVALQARGSMVQAYNRYIASWKQLAASLGLPGMPLTAVTGRVDMPIPHFDHDGVLGFVLANHSDILTAQIEADKARLVARLAEVQPYPDVIVNLGFQRDFTTPPYGAVANVNVGVPVPFWNRNQGNVQQARAQLNRAIHENQRVKNELTSKVAEAFGRYESNRVLLEMYRTQILPNQVQAFRASVARHAVGDKGVSYYDVVNSQQTLANLINTYLVTLGEQWTAVVDIAQLMQTRDLFQVQLADEVAPIPDVEEFHPARRFHRR